MLKSSKFIATLVLLIAVGFLVSGCENLKYTFGGTIPSADGPDDSKANFGGVIDACECGSSIPDIEGCIADPNPDCILAIILDLLNFGCDDIHSNIVYHDKDSSSHPGLRLKAKVEEVFDCSGIFGPGSNECVVCDGLASMCGGQPVFMIAAKIQYKSQNRKYTDGSEQTGIVCMTDNGEGANASSPDYLAVQLNGAYGDYMNCGPVSGNVQGHDCDDS